MGEGDSESGMMQALGGLAARDEKRCNRRLKTAAMMERWFAFE